MKKITKALSILLVFALVLGFAACANSKNSDNNASKTYKIGICNYVDDASLNQIYENIEAQLKVIEHEKGVKFNILYDNCNGDTNVLAQIISNFKAENVDLMVGIATPVAIAMQAATTDIPIVFSAVSDPVGAGLVNSLDNPGANITGTSDYLNTEAIMNLIFANNPETKTVGLLYDMSQDSSKTPIEEAKKFLDKKGIKYVERTGTTIAEVQQAAQALVNDKVDAVFTPTDNTIMKSELSIYETFAAAKIPHFTGADSFALNGAFLGYGVDYIKLGVETAKMIANILVDGADTATLPVTVFDNGTATINTDICKELGYDYNTLETTFKPYCTKIQSITTAESFTSAAE